MGLLPFRLTEVIEHQLIIWLLFRLTETNRTLVIVSISNGLTFQHYVFNFRNSNKPQRWRLYNRRNQQQKTLTDNFEYRQ